MKQDPMNQTEGIDEDSLKQNEEFLKHHKELNLTEHIYCAEAIERIEAHCGCKVICNPNFSGISFFVENHYYQAAQDILCKLYEEEKKEIERKNRREIKKAQAVEKLRKKLEDALARCDHPTDEEIRFAEDCLKTLKLKDYVPQDDAERYRHICERYSEYFRLLSWPEDVRGHAAKTYLNSTLLKNV
ncbi:hypothetical protein PITCH_A80030 [uncultured Desulfobacterium sp.]|uniref:Uncharacterized protein n=1 Tax=uncultured Desulfobacterium sp. TaxID=201089 RepID=A0A445N2V0_9BACT|nr:hypothetical protein PITCH_A80030 [uncultured Desulfobacterium sp.]